MPILEKNINSLNYRLVKYQRYITNKINFINLFLKKDNNTIYFNF